MTDDERLKLITWLESRAQGSAMPGASRMYKLALDAIRAQPANEPLTLEQLRQMAQDLMAWCVVHECEKADCTAIIDYDNLGKYGEKGKIVAVTSAYGEPLKESDYGKTWLAYGHKPGGEQE